MAANNKTSRLRFSTQDDIELLRVVVGENPFEDASKWKTIQKTIAETCEKDFTVRALKGHLEHLLKLFVQEDRANLKKSGTEEEYAEKERLLQETNDLRRDFLSTRSFGTNNSQQKGIQMREEATKSCSAENVAYILQEDGTLLKEDDAVPVEQHENHEFVIGTPSTSASTSLTLGPTYTRKRKSNDALKSSTLEFLKEKTTADRELNLQQLQLEEKKLKLEERKLLLKENQFQLETEERRIRLEMEIKEREAHLKVIEQQQQLISFFLSSTLNKST